MFFHGTNCVSKPRPDFSQVKTPKYNVKSTLHVDPAGQKPNTIDPDLVK